MAKVSDSRGSSYEDFVFLGLESRGFATWPKFRYLLHLRLNYTN